MGLTTNSSPEHAGGCPEFVPMGSAGIISPSPIVKEKLGLQDVFVSQGMRLIIIYIDVHA